MNNTVTDELRAAVPDALTALRRAAAVNTTGREGRW